LNYFDIAKAFAPLPRKTQTSLCIAAQAGDTDASDTLVKTNMRLAINVARKHKRNGIELDDLIGTAAGATLDAIRKFDPNCGANFPMVARQWMVARCQEVVKGSKAVTGDDRTTRTLYRQIQKAVKTLTEEDMSITPENAARIMNLDPAKVIAAWPVVMGSATSLSAPCGADDAATFGDTLVSKTIPQDEALIRTRQGERVAQVLAAFVDTLTLRDRHIFQARNLAEYLGNDPTPQQILADANGISKPRVCQIEKGLNRKCAEFLRDRGFNG
jgi:RNA polymerase nonessential primary-like sigma factor